MADSISTDLITPQATFCTQRQYRAQDDAETVHMAVKKKDTLQR